jgi:hypothetical protein
MKLTTRLFVFFLMFALFNEQVYARKKKQYFDQKEFEIDFQITHPILTANFIDNGNNEILFIGENDNSQKILVLYVFDPAFNNFVEYVQMAIPDNTIAFDLFTDTKGIESVLLLDAKGLSKLSFENNSITYLVETQSLYLDPNPQFVVKKSLVKDFNGDGLDDIIISDFSHLNILLQQKDGEFKNNTLPISATIDMGLERVSFSEPRIFNVDSNFDQLVDLVVLAEGQLQIYEQSKEGDFSPIKNRITMPMQVSALPWWSIKGADGESADQSDLEHRMLENIEDINGDGIIDIMVRHTKSSGVLDRQNQYEIHYGIKSDGIKSDGIKSEERLSFNQQPDTLISAEGTLSGLELLDINADGRKEILVSSFDIGISQIIGALLSGSIDQDVYVFSLDEQDKYNEEPLFSEEVDLNFSLSSGSTGQPVILMADFNGDGFKELVLSASKKRLAIYRGEDNNKRYKSRYKKHKLVLPQDGSMLTVVDLNNDKRQEIIVRYGKQDDDKLRNKVVILSAK